MDSPREKLLSSAPDAPQGQETIESITSEDFVPPIPTDRLYQIAALAAGIILLVTAF